MPPTPRSAKFAPWTDDDEVPVIDSTERFSDVVSKLSTYVVKAIDAAYSWEQIRTSVVGQSLRPLISSLCDDCHHPAIVAALLACRYVFGSNDSDDTGLSESRALACEFVAWQFLTFLSEKELIEYLTWELPSYSDNKTPSSIPRSNGDLSHSVFDGHESAPLLESHSPSPDGLGPPRRATFGTTDGAEDELHDVSPEAEDALALSLSGMNALEIAAIADAKHFIAQRPVQKLVDDLWEGDVIFWENLSVHAVKKARVYNKRVADPFVRLRVPKYQKTAQVAFFIAFLLLYYTVLLARNPSHVNAPELFLYIWIAAYAYDEFGEIKDAGLKFYRTDFWSLWDVAIILIGATFFIIRMVGLGRGSAYLTDIAFDVLSLVALFLVPRIFSIFSLNQYVGALIPVLKEMTKAFCKFLPVIVVLYMGFLTTFSMLARDKISYSEMSWILVKVFFGSSYLGFDVALSISPLFGYTLMLIFVALTNILLLTSLVSLVSNSLTEVMNHAREEYYFQYSIYVLESSTSRRLTYALPPLNLVFLLLRPLRLFLSSEDVRRVRIVVLKATHLPFVALIWAYERSRRLLSHYSPSSLDKAPPSVNRPLASSQLTFEPERDLVKSSPTRAVLKKPTLSSSGRDSGAATECASCTGVNTQEDLMALIQSLAQKVDSLTAMVAGQQD